jgi:hypothetical protein
MQRGHNRSTGPGQLSTALYFNTPPGIGWRLHISKVAAEMRVASAVGRFATITEWRESSNRLSHRS